MANITPATLEAIYYAFSLQFQTAYEAVKPWHERIATDMPSMTRSERYAWMKRLPIFREWIGERYFNNLTARESEIKNKDWEDSIEVDRNDIEDDRIGVFGPMFMMLGQQAALWPDHVLGPIIQNAKNVVCWDTAHFFDTSHPVDQDKAALGTYSNLFALNPLTMGNVAATRAAMASYVGEDGKPLMIEPNLIVVPPQLREAAAQICNMTFIAPLGNLGANQAGGFQENVLKGSFDFLVVPQFSNEPGVWYLADTSKPIKPFIWQTRKAPQFVSVTDPASVPVFNHRKFQFGADARGNGGVTIPWLVSRNEPT